MNHKDVMKDLQNLTGRKILAKEIVDVLGLSSPKIFYTRSQRNSQWADWEVKRVFEHFSPEQNINAATFGDKVEIQYYTNPNLKTKLTVPDVTTVWLDRQIIENRWKREPKNIRVITMLGDKMDHGAYPLKMDDILLMDISDTDVTKSGIYAFTTNNDSYMFINGINRKFDNTYRFYFYNPVYLEKTLTDADIERADIRIVGRIFKNLSLTI